MQFGTWENFCNKPCTSCDKSLIGEKPQALAFEGGDWYHESCLLRAKRAFAAAMVLARLNYSIAEYVANREDVGVF